MVNRFFSDIIVVISLILKSIKSDLLTILKETKEHICSIMNKNKQIKEEQIKNGERIRSKRLRLKINQITLSIELGISTLDLEAYECGRKPIPKQMEVRFGNYFKKKENQRDYILFMNSQRPDR